MGDFRFVFMADCQLGCYASFSGMDEADIRGFAEREMVVTAVPPVAGFAWDAERYEAAVALSNALAPAFSVMGGDMVDDPFDDEQYDAVIDITGRLSHPMHWVAGNHDIGADGNVPTTASIEHYRQRFGADHYALVHEGATLLVVDTPVWVHAEVVPDEWERQLAWLRTELARTRSRPGPTLVLGHHPLFTRSADEPDDYWNVPRERRAVLLDLLVEHEVSTYLCGHWHRNGGGWYEGLEVVVTGPVGYPLGNDPSGLRVVDVAAGEVEHRYVALPMGERV